MGHPRAEFVSESLNTMHRMDDDPTKYGVVNAIRDGDRINTIPQTFVAGIAFLNYIS